MEKIRCIASVASITSEPRFCSSLVSQLIFGEYGEILSQQGYFFYIRTLSDSVEGWVFYKNIEVVDEFVPQGIIIEPYKFLQGKLLSFGSELEDYKLSEYLQLCDFEILAEKMLGIPYLSGGRSFFGIDADGLSQLVYKSLGISLPRKANEQAKYGKVLDFIEESEVGDLAFFENEQQEIDHVGIMLDNYRLIHAFGEVRIDSLDISGIYNKDLKKHTHRLRFVKRIK